MAENDVILSDRDKLIKRITAKVIDACYDDGIFNNCTNCSHFDEKAEICKLYTVRPPAHIIVSGCESHTDEIPF